MNTSCDIAIIGGGVIGLSCAWRLAQAGAKVHLYEEGEVGRGASWAAAGMLAAQVEAAVHPSHQAEDSGRSAFFDLCLQSRALYASFAQELLEATGIDIELSLKDAPTSDWRTPGILYVGENDDEAFREFEKQREAGKRVELREGHARWLPEEGQVKNRKLVAALKAAAKTAGAKIHEYCPVFGVHHKNLVTKNGVWRYEKFLISSGASGRQLEGVEEACLPPVHPVSGEMLAARASKPLDHIIYSRDAYLVPRRDGRILIGATMQFLQPHNKTTRAARDFLLRAAQRLMPNLRFEIEDHWAGLRPATPDNLPILGRTSIENLFVATGHFRNGILLTPITAQLMTDCILNDVAPPQEFSLQRFAKGVLAPCASN